MKKVISLTLTILLFFSFSVTVSAKSVFDNAAQPYYEKVREASSTLSIDGTTASCGSSLRGNPDVKKIVAVQTLQKENSNGIWKTYKNTSWTKTVRSNIIVMNTTKSELESGTYRLKTVFTVTDDDGDENITVYSSEKTVN